MRENLIVKKITTEFISGGMEYKVECECELMGSCIMSWTLSKVWAMGANNKYVRLYPYDLDLWESSMETEIDNALLEEI